MAYTPEQNGRAERENRTLVEAARTMILAKGLPKKLWAEAINTAAYILNRASKEELKNKSPYEMWHGSRASISHLRVFGTKVYVHIPKQKRLKWDSKADRGIHVGYGDETKGYKIWYSNRNKVEVQRDVIFEEEGEDRHKTTEEDKIERRWTEVHEKPAEEAEEEKKAKRKHKEIRQKREKKPKQMLRIEMSI